MKTGLRVLLFFSLLAITACKKTTPITEEDGFDYGGVRGGKYTNGFFDIEVNIPTSWHVLDIKERDAVKAMGEELIKDKDQAESQELIKASEINTATLLAATKYSPETVGAFNPNISLIAENIKALHSVKSGADYLLLSSKAFEQMDIDMQSIDTVYTKRPINGVEFYQMNLSANLSGIMMYQTYLATVKNGFALLFVYSYSDESQKAELEKIVNSIKYNK